jgi:hypothetical protein
MIIAQIIGQGGPLVPTGIGLGSLIAVICSWERNRSIIWAIIAAFLSWIYVIYFALTRRAKRPAGAPAVLQFPLGVPRDRELRPPKRH